MKDIEKLVNLWYAAYEKLDECENLISELADIIDDGTRDEAFIDLPQSYHDYEQQEYIDFEAKLQEMFPDYIFQFDGKEWMLVKEIA